MRKTWPRLKPEKAAAAVYGVPAFAWLAAAAAMDWELSKENFQPLKQGRLPGQLQPLKPQAAPAASADLEETRKYAPRPASSH